MIMMRARSVEATAYASTSEGAASARIVGAAVYASTSQRAAQQAQGFQRPDDGTMRLLRDRDRLLVVLPMSILTSWAGLPHAH